MLPSPMHRQVTAGTQGTATTFDTNASSTGGAAQGDTSDGWDWEPSADGNNAAVSGSDDEFMAEMFPTCVSALVAWLLRSSVPLWLGAA